MGGGHQLLQDAAGVVTMVGITLRAQGHQLPLQRAQAFEAGPHTGQLVADQFVNVAAVLARLAHKRQQAFDVGQRNVERAAVAYKGQPLQMRLAIGAVAVGLARWRRQQTRLLVIADGLHIHPRGLAELADLEGVVVKVWVGYCGHDKGLSNKGLDPVPTTGFPIIGMTSPLANLTNPTPLLDFAHPSLQRLVAERGWATLPTSERIGRIYDFVRNEIAFGYNTGDELTASQVLADGYGQCNTKATLFMALLRATGVPCRFHGFTIDKALQKGAITGLAYWLAPRSIIHSWVEVQLDGRWINLEGFILDAAYLQRLQARHPGATRFCGFGAATPDLQAPGVDWRGTDTYIQKDGINHDFGVFESPDAFYARHGSNLSGAKRWLYQHLVRHQMNRNVRRIRGH